MGQAKQRGNLDARIAEATRKAEAQRPAFIICNNCLSELKDVRDLDTNIPGIEAGFFSCCPKCGHETYAFRGKEAAISEALAMVSAGRGPAILGFCQDSSLSRKDLNGQPAE